ncbi:MAG: hypothetical protein HY541_01630 [Deltaproteobacteria bacterium]|nr:hypothetical protein [Deltaproteobacteria bacterium]
MSSCLAVFGLESGEAARQALKWNIARFRADFMFTLTAEEKNEVVNWDSILPTWAKRLFWELE